MLKQYLNKRSIFSNLIASMPAPDLGLIVTIPCYNEPDLFRTMHSLKACSLPGCSVEVIIAINHAENSSEKIKNHNQKTLESAQELAQGINHPKLIFHPVLLPDLPKKHAGVGLARKAAMDEAVRRFDLINNEKGVIVCFDADAQVQPNYLQEIHRFFENDMTCQAASIHYEHPLDGTEFEEEVYEAIIAYELHLRYYVHALKKAGLPTATQTVGSSMAVRANAYAAQGGMNRRKAGEDFYFIHKFTPLGGYRQITSTTVIPSPRISDRVPFGTGRAVSEILSGEQFMSYAPETFSDLSAFLPHSEQLYQASEEEVVRFLKQLPKSVETFLKTENFTEKLAEIQQNSSQVSTFRKRFFRWFDAFKAMKFVHHARDQFYPNLSIENAVRQWLLTEDVLEEKLINKMTASELLNLFRKWDKTP